ncbi:shTK domain protein [Oesophagostomum dentatum]|uniref:ShTK domain protein n=1 Tax=Oesophagostomum dentatum TaxID=61180 RepID=A0A0B1SIK3_OESDE|nr:shTK domain protein [Oesophagostomum dentatum]
MFQRNEVLAVLAFLAYIHTSVYAQNLNTGCFDRVHPITGISDCPQRQHLCLNPLYRTLMQQQCPKTCGLCTDVPITPPSSKSQE